MFGLIVRFQLTPGTEAAFDALASSTLERIVSAEPGTLQYTCHVVEDDPSARIFVELYRDRAAFDEHERTDHVKRFLAERVQYLAEAPRVEFLTTSSGKSLAGALPREPGEREERLP